MFIQLSFFLLIVILIILLLLDFLVDFFTVCSYFIIHKFGDYVSLILEIFSHVLPCFIDCGYHSSILWIHLIGYLFNILVVIVSFILKHVIINLQFFFFRLIRFILFIVLYINTLFQPFILTDVFIWFHYAS